MVSCLRVLVAATAVGSVAALTSACSADASADDTPPVTLISTTEDPPDPAVVANIDRVEADVAARVGESYSYLFHYLDSDQPAADCGFGNARIVVQDGVVTDAVELPGGEEPGCRIDPSDVPTLAEVFDIARALAGASHFVLETGPANGNVVNMRASETDLSVQFSISNLSTSTAPTRIGWDEVGAEAEAARVRWGLLTGDYVVRITSINLSLDNAERSATVVDGRPISYTEAGQPVDPATVSTPWPPFTVDDLFAIIDDNEGGGNVAAVFEPDTGLPSSLWFEPTPGTADDEFTLHASLDRR